MAWLFVDHRQNQEPQLAVVEGSAAAFVAPPMTAAMAMVIILAIFSVVVTVSPAMASTRIFGVRTASVVGASMFHSSDIGLDISYVKI
jgi:hypothetical protein